MLHLYRLRLPGKSVKERTYHHRYVHDYGLSGRNGCPGDEILNRRSLPAGGYAWNIEDDDTKNIRFEDGIWTISQRQKEIYRQDKAESDDSLGKMQTLTYEGELPCADCPGIRYDLTIRSREHSGDGTFSLSHS